MKIPAALLLLVPALAWANPATDAEQAAERVLVEQDVLSYYLSASDEGRVTLLFGKYVADWQMDAVVQQLEKEPAIKGLTHVRVDTDFCTLR